MALNTDPKSCGLVGTWDTVDLQNCASTADVMRAGVVSCYWDSLGNILRRVLLLQSPTELQEARFRI